MARRLSSSSRSVSAPSAARPSKRPSSVSVPSRAVTRPPSPAARASQSGADGFEAFVFPEPAIPHEGRHQLRQHVEWFRHGKPGGGERSRGALGFDRMLRQIGAKADDERIPRRVQARCPKPSPHPAARHSATSAQKRGAGVSDPCPSPACRAKASSNAKAATNESCCTAPLARTSTDAIRLPAPSLHARPRRPRPAVWRSAITQWPSARLDRAFEQPVVGRTHLAKVGKGRRGQPATVNSDAAARPVAATIGVIASMPSGEQNSAAAAIIAPLVTLPSLVAGTPGSSKNITLTRRR